MVLDDTGDISSTFCFLPKLAFDNGRGLAFLHARPTTRADAMRGKWCPSHLVLSSACLVALCVSLRLCFGFCSLFP